MPSLARLDLMSKFHEGRIGGHLKGQRYLQRMRKRFYWPAMGKTSAIARVPAKYVNWSKVDLETNRGGGFHRQPPKNGQWLQASSGAGVLFLLIPHCYPCQGSEYPNFCRGGHDTSDNGTWMS